MRTTDATGAHGEYKVPGGKLVVADVDVVDGRLRNVEISGDFFLEPASAFEALATALEGASSALDAGSLGARISAALPADAVLLGFSAEAVGVAVRRAVTAASGWREFDWRLIHAGPQEPAMHMALDEVLIERVAAGRRPPTLRIWEWASPAVVIGSFQSIRNEVDVQAADRFGIEVVRRISGGGAMFIEPGNTITYSLYAPGSLVQGLSYVDSYAFLDDWVLGVLGELGISAWYQPINDITSEVGKIAGAAQRRVAGDAVLHHVTMAYDIDAEKMQQVLRIGREKLSDKGTPSAVKRVDPLRRQTGRSRAEVIERLIDGFGRRNGLTPDRLSDHELDAAAELVRSKHSDHDWIHRLG